MPVIRARFRYVLYVGARVAPILCVVGIQYNAVFLDGIWLRAPYLHNGSVPTLADLLKIPAERPTLFWRGYDLYDPATIGFVSNGARAEELGTRYDVNERSNGNGGHLYGTTLSQGDKDSLLEYLKLL